jgi:peroxiredoxin
MGPQQGPQPIYPEMQGTTPITPTPSMQSFGAANEPSGYGQQAGVPYAGAQAPSPSGRGFKDTGPIRVRRTSPMLFILLIIVIVGLSGFAVYQVGWLKEPVHKIQEFTAGIKLPGWLHFGNKDTIPPSILNASASNISESGAIVIWKTDEPSTSQVMICESVGGGSCTWTDLDKNLVTDHSVTINDLKPSSKYHYTATSTDAASNQGTAEGDFTTLAKSTAALVISGVNVSNVTEVAGTISWTTDKPGTTQVAYGTTNAYGSTTTLNQVLTTSHSATLNGLAPNTTYHFQVKSQDSSGNAITSPDQVFTTAGTAITTAEVGAEIGMRAPDFTLPTLDGKQVSLNGLLGKSVVLNFWQDVQQSRNELSVIQEAYVKLPRDKVAILAISVNQTPAITQNVVTSKGLTLPVLTDESGSVAATYKVAQTPVTIFIDSQGIIRETSYYPATLKTFTRVNSILSSMQ